jgi:hypothetical protein
MATTPTAQPATPANATNSKNSPPALMPFRGGTQPTLQADGYTNSVTLSSSNQDLPIYNPSPNNLIRAIWVQVTIAVASNTATVAFNGDMPLGVFSSVTFADSNEKPIVGPVDSYTIGMWNKYGGFDNCGDPRASAAYSVPSLSGGTGGSAKFVLRIPVEAVGRTGVGTLQNQSSNSTFQLKLTANTISNIYATAPAGASGAISPTLTVQIFEEGYWRGSNSAYDSKPKAAGSTQYLTRGTYNALNGAQQVQLAQGLGYPIRTILDINYATGSARSSADFPDPVQFLFKGSNLFNASQILWRDRISRAYDLQSETLDVANGTDTGVFVLPFMQDFTAQPGYETGLGYLVTDPGDSFQLVGSFGASSTLYHCVNYIAPVGPPSVLQAKAS